MPESETANSFQNNSNSTSLPDGTSNDDRLFHPKLSCGSQTNDNARNNLTLIFAVRFKDIEPGDISSLQNHGHGKNPMFLTMWDFHRHKHSGNRFSKFYNTVGQLERNCVAMSW
jgi:hypothetical protein